MPVRPEFRGLRMVYQPVVDLGSFRVVGFEALARPRGQSPSELFARAEEEGWAVELDRVCVALACRGAAPWLPPGAVLFINLTPSSFRLMAAGRPVEVPSWTQLRSTIVWEVSETVEAPVDETASRVMARFGSLALDDVGDGKQEFLKLFALCPAWVKVSRSIISRAAAHPDWRPLLKLVVQAASLVKARVVAEGIETGEELAECLRCGVGYGQGFLFAPPSETPPLAVSPPDGFRRRQEVSLAAGQRCLRAR